MCNYIFDKMDIKLRIEQPSDYNETENVTREAFWNHFSPGCDEHYLLHIMRNHPIQSPNQKIPDRKTKCVIKTHINIKQNVIFGAKLKPV